MDLKQPLTHPEEAEPNKDQEDDGLPNGAKQDGRVPDLKQEISVRQHKELVSP